MAAAKSDIEYEELPPIRNIDEYPCKDSTEDRPTELINHVQSRPLPIDPIQGKWIFEKQINYIQNNRVRLLQNLDLHHGYVIDHMVEKSALTEAEHEALKSITLKKDRISKLFDILKCKDYKTFDIFIDGLKRDNSPHYSDFSDLSSEILKQNYHQENIYNDSDSEEIDEDPYFSHSAASLQVNCDVYEDHFVANSLEESLNTYEDNPSYVIKFETNVIPFKENCILEIRNALTEFASNVSPEVDLTCVSKNASDEVGKVAMNNSPKYDLLALFKDSSVNTVLKPFTRDASLLIQESTLVIIDKSLTDLLHSKLANTKFCFGHTSFNSLVLLHEDHIKKLSDPRGEKWFYAAKVSSVQMERILSESNIKGSFYIYESTKSTDQIPLNLSIITSDQLEILHYHIHRTEEDEYYIKNNDKIAKFRSIHTLVQYYKISRGNIACKLKWSPKELQEYKPMFPSSCAVDNSKLEISSESDAYLPSNSSTQRRPKIQKGKYNDQIVIVKTTSSSMPSKLEEDDLLSEARILHDIKHDNIRELVGVCFVNARPYLILGYAGVQNLHQYIKNNKIKVKLVMDIFVQLASALVHLCEKKFIIHRDIAARNCLVENKGPEGIRVKLADFDMAVRVMQCDEYHADDDDNKCSIRWAAPEVLKDRVYSTKSDVWALGIVFWEMASGGKMPYTTLTTNAEVAATIVRGKLLLPIPKTDKEYSQIFKRIINHCLAYRIEERYSANHIFVLSQQYLGKLCTTGSFEPIYAGLEANFSQLKHHSEEEKPARNKIGKKLKALVK